MSNKYDISNGKPIKLIEPEIGELQGTVVIKPSSFEHPVQDEPQLILGSYIVRDRKTKKYVYLSDAISQDRIYEFNDHEKIKEELKYYGIDITDIEMGWEPVPHYEDQYESVFLDA